MSSVTNKTRVRKLALHVAKTQRAHRFDRVAKEFYDDVEAHARRYITDKVMRHPSKGKTLK